MDYIPYSPWNSPGQNTGLSSHSLLHGIFPTQESNWCHLHWPADSSPLNHLGSTFSYEALSELRFIKAGRALWFRSWGPRFWNQRHHLSLLEERPSPSDLISLNLRGLINKTKMCLSHWVFLFFTFWLHSETSGILVVWPGMEPAPPALEARSLNHWTAREVPGAPFCFLGGMLPESWILE